jgi:hypothetical protein
MKRSFSILRIAAIAAVVAGLAGVVAWHQGLFQPFGLYRPSNSLMVIVNIHPNNPVQLPANRASASGWTGRFVRWIGYRRLVPGGCG